MFTSTFDWYDNAKTILLITVDPDGWHWDDAYHVVQTQVKMMQDLPHEVHTIFSFTSPPRIPADNNIFRNLRNLMNTRADNEGLSIFIGTNRLFKSFLETAGRMSQLRWLIGKYRYVTTIEQALAEIDAYKKQYSQSEQF